jgi:ABC-type transport system involved in cytochrome c biogenesis permease subunit
VATGTFSNEAFANSKIATVPSLDLWRIGWLALRAMGSLKITVAMFALGTLILFVGTLAQDEETIVDVKKAYFNSWIATVPFDVFVPQTIKPHDTPIPFAFAMPGGAAIGLILLVNLIAAKLTRFKMNAKGSRFAAGLAFTVAGFVLVGLIIVSAHLGDGLQGEPPFSYGWIWLGTKASVWLLAAGAVAWSVAATPKTRVLRWTAFVLAGLLIALSGFLIWDNVLNNDTYRIPDPGLRIVWQLTKSLVVSAVLLAGLLLLFGNRGGNVLIHLGVGLLMLGQFIFGDAQREERITVFEGQKTQVAFEQDTVELAFIDESDASKNSVVAFDHPMLQQSANQGKFIGSASLPFEVRVDKYMESSKGSFRRSPAKPTDENADVQGLGREWQIEEAAKSGGAKSTVNYASAVISLRTKDAQQPLGKFLVSQFINDDAAMYTAALDSVEVDGKKWNFGLRFRRNYKDYKVLLDDVVLVQYTGTAKPKDYSSFVKIENNEGSTVQQGRIWMNNPMRFRGETFYQSGYLASEMSPNGVEQTTLQVVTNAGWLIPYVACVLSGLGMLVHFGGTFARFASRYDRSAALPVSEPAQDAKLVGEKISSAKQKKALAAKPKVSSQRSLVSIAVPVLFCGLAALYVGRNAMIPNQDRDEINWYAIGEIPTQYGGRIKPLASASAEFLEILSNKKFALSKEGHQYEPEQKTGKEIDSVTWIMAVFAREPWVLEAPLIRIDAPEITTVLGLKRHKSHRYSHQEIRLGLSKIMDQVKSLFETKREAWSFEQDKLGEVIEKISALENLLDAYTPLAPRISDKPGEMQAAIEQLQFDADRIRARSPLAVIPPLFTPPAEPGMKAPPAKWEGFGTALFETVKLKSMGINSKADSVLSFMQLVEACSEETKKPSKVNGLVEEFKSNVKKEFGETIRIGKVPFEAWYEHFDPIVLASRLYLVCGILALLSFLFARGPLRSTSFWLCILALVVHTIAISSRVYISERPPVVTLYSAAVFIGWAMVLFCAVTELLFPISISVLVASVAGYLTLSVAYGLDIGDSMPVLEAVLDTQFWLSTHVISVSLGYSATFVSGFVGIGIVIAMWIAKIATKKSALQVEATNSIPILYRICYGVVCFGLFFSFVGTVLGGLWGDDSWGRFWGWDPKENGAMMIVLWNALLLHAKWDKMIAALGFGILAIFGNIITAWSMFGTNLLGVGLHSYGFNSTTFYYLVGFALSQLVMILVGVALVMAGGLKSKVEAE